MRPRNSAFLRCIVAATASILIRGDGTAMAEDVPQQPLLQRLFAQVDDLVTARCLTPASGEALQRAVADGVLQAALGNTYELSKGGIQPHYIDIEVRDRSGASYAVRVALRGSGSDSGAADGAGAVFDFYLRDAGADPQVRAALLAAAAAVDAAIPETTLGRCAGAGAPRADRRYPRALALGGAFAQLLIVTAALFFALRVLADTAARRRR